MDIGLEALKIVIRETLVDYFSLDAIAVLNHYQEHDIMIYTT